MDTFWILTTLSVDGFQIATGLTELQCKAIVDSYLGITDVLAECTGPEGQTYAHERNVYACPFVPEGE